VSHGYNATNTYTVDSNAYHQVVGLSDLPAGPYVVLATVTNLVGDKADCELNFNGSHVGGNAGSQLASVDQGYGMTFTGVITSTGADVVEVECTSIIGVTLNSSEILGSIEAIKLDALN